MRFTVTHAGIKKCEDVSATEASKHLRDICGINRKQQKEYIRRCIKVKFIRLHDRQGASVFLSARNKASPHDKVVKKQDNTFDCCFI